MRAYAATLGAAGELVVAAAALIVATVALVLGSGPAVATPARAHLAVAGPVPANQSLQLVIPLVVDDRGQRPFALAVSTPSSPLYGHFESVAQLSARFGARPAVASAVIRYLRGQGATGVRLSATRMYVAATLTVARAERACGTPLALLRAADGQRFIAPAARASAASASVRLPVALQGRATGVVGLDTEPVIRRTQLGVSAAAGAPAGPPNANAQPPSAYEPRTGTAAGCRRGRASRGFTPNQYLTAYGYDGLHRAGLTGAGQRLAVIEIDGFKRSDIRTFGRCFGIHVPPITTHTVGFSHPLAPGGEATLDLEVLSAAAPGARSLDVYENGDNATNIVRAFTAPLIAPGAKPQILSASLGTCEPDLQMSLQGAGIQSIERTLELAAATGTTVLSSSGDNGSTACQTNDGGILPSPAVSYPASSAFVTGVGGTNFHLDAANHIVSEMVWNDTYVSASAGGGGFSALFGRPSYQQAVVTANARVVPDVSLLADLAPGYAIFCSAHLASPCRGWISVGGTSAAAPLLAGGLALIDQDLHRRHRQLLGLVNPLLYQLGGSALAPAVFRDVTDIGNDLGPYLPGGSKPVGCCTATVGFDPASGWGSVNLAALDLAAVQSARPAPNVSLTLPAHQRPIAAHALLARLSCSVACRAYASGNVVLSSTTGVGVRSSMHRFARAGSRLLRITFSSRLEQRLKAARRAGHHLYAELFGVAVDAQGQPLTVTAGAVIYFNQ